MHPGDDEHLSYLDGLLGALLGGYAAKARVSDEEFRATFGDLGFQVWRRWRMELHGMIGLPAHEVMNPVPPDFETLRDVGLRALEAMRRANPGDMAGRATAGDDFDDLLGVIVAHGQAVKPGYPGFLKGHPRCDD